MIYSIADTEASGGVFSGWGREAIFNPGDWESRLPSLDTRTFFSLDPAIGEVLDGEGASGFDMTEYLGRLSFLSGLRNCMANIATVWGYFQTGVQFVKTIFDGTLKTITAVVDTINNVLNSDAFTAAINSIGWIPIVGWIIKIVVEVAKLVTGIIASVREARQERRQARLDELSREYALPMGSWDTGADTILGQLLQIRLGALGKELADFEWLVRPHYPANSPNDFVRMKQKYNPSDPCGAGWLIYSEKFREKGDASSQSESPGLGFVPGTMNIHAAMQLPTSGGGSVLDIGSYYPVTQMMAANMWSQAVKGDSGLTFAIDTDSVADDWINYVQAAVEYAWDEVRKGWSMISGPVRPGGTKFECTDCDTGVGYCDKKVAGKKKLENRIRSIPGTGHYSALMQYYQQLFDMKRRGQYDDIRDYDFEDITPVRSLDALRARQEAMINSLKCMYLDDSGERFKAIRGSMRTKWRSNVQAVFESGEWRNIDYRDVVKGEDVDQSLHNILAPKGQTPDEFFQMDLPEDDPRRGKQPGGMQLKYAGPSVLGDPTPPDMPDPINFDQLSAARSPGRRPGGSAGGGGALVVVGAAAAVAVLAMKR